MIICENRVPNGCIMIPKEDINDYESVLNYGSKELRYYLDRITSASFKIEPDDGKTSGIVLRLDNECFADEFEFKYDNDRLIISGGNRGVLYGCYELLERLGCRFFTHNCEKIPTITKLDLPEITEKHKPVIEYREHNYVDVRDNVKFAVKCRLNGGMHPIPKRLGGHISYAIFVHSFDVLMPPEKYAKEHPEYYELIDGKRNTIAGQTQLCLTNPDVLRICTEAVRQKLLEHPEASIISVSQNDWGIGCTCEKCIKVDKEEESAAGTLLRFVNKIAEELEPEFPNVVFDTLAYNHTRPAPKITKNRHNVCVRLCSIESCFSHPFETCDDEKRMVPRPDGSKGSFIKDLRDWGKVCDRMYIWDYTTCFANYPSPHPNWRVLQPNIKAMVKNNVKGIFEQANGASRGGVDFNELRLYLISKLLWNPECDIEKHRKEFMEYYYGDAAKHLDNYLNHLCDVVDTENIHVGFNDNPDGALFDEKKLDEYEVYFDKAADAVKGDALRLYRVEKARLSIRWVRLKRQSMLYGIYDAEKINSFFTDWRAFNMSRIDEWCNFETTHRALLEGTWRGIDLLERYDKEEPELF